jgi:Fe-S-cluster containining protein
MYLGDYIAIERQIGPFDFECCSVSTGTPFLARIDDDKRELFLDRTWSEQHPTACPFLRLEGERIRCTIHETSPCQCKSYRCVVMRVFDTRGTMVGKVTGTLALHSDDPALRAVWEEAERIIPQSSADVEKLMQQFLEGWGYRVE